MNLGLIYLCEEKCKRAWKASSVAEFDDFFLCIKCTKPRSGRRKADFFIIQTCVLVLLPLQARNKDSQLAFGNSSHKY